MNSRIAAPLARFVAFLAIVVATTMPVHATTLSIFPSFLNVTVGQSFSLDIQIDGVADLYGFQFDLGFDPTILSATSITEGAFLALGGDTLYIDGMIDNASGTVSNTADVLNGAVPGVSGTGILATVHFDALATGISDINIFNTVFLDSSLSDIQVSNISSGRVTVSNSGIPAPEPSTLFLAGAGLVGLMFSRRRSTI